MVILYSFLSGDSRGRERFLSIPPPYPGSVLRGRSGLAAVLVELVIPAVDPVRGGEHHVRHRPQFRGGERHADGFPVQSPHDHQRTVAGQGVGANRVGTDRGEEGSARVELELDAGVVAAVGDGAVTDGEVALRAAEVVDDAGGGEDDVDGAVVGGAHAYIVTDGG